MDEPIFLSGERSPREDPIDHVDVVENALKYDDKNEFLMAITHPDFVECRHDLEPDMIFLYDAVRVATAVFEGETEGIYDVKDMLSDGISPIHLAAGCNAPKLTKYLIERGDSVDVACDVTIYDIKHPSPIDLALESIESLLHSGWSPDPEEDRMRFWTPRFSIMELLVCVCKVKRRGLEALRLLVQNTQNKERVRQAFIDYADKGKLVHLAALFLAAPDLFLPSPFVSVRDGLSSLEKMTTIEEGMSLLLDVFAAVGDKLVAFVRVEDPIVRRISEYGHADIITMLLREVAYRKRGVSSRNDYFLRFFKPVDQLSSPHTHHEITAEKNLILFFQMRRYDINTDYINGILSFRKPEDAAVVYRAIANKLSSMSSLHGLFLEIDIISMKREKYLPEWFRVAYIRKFEPDLKPIPMKAASIIPKVDSKFGLPKSLEKTVMQRTKLNSFFSLIKQSNLPMVIKRLIRR